MGRVSRQQFVGVLTFGELNDADLGIDAPAPRQYSLRCGYWHQLGIEVIAEGLEPFECRPDTSPVGVEGQVDVFGKFFDGLDMLGGQRRPQWGHYVAEVMLV